MNKYTIDVSDEKINVGLRAWSQFGLNRMFWKLDFGFNEVSTLGYHEYWKEEELLEDGWKISSKDTNFISFKHKDYEQVRLTLAY
jgi:hypothetical protein